MQRKRRSVEDRFWPKVLIKTDAECWPWLASFKPEGYGQLSSPGGGKPLYAHRVSYELRYGEIPSGLLVMHTCDFRACVNPAHLMLGTDADNAKDKCMKGRHNPPRGEEVNTAKLTAEKVKFIRGSSSSNAYLAEKLGVSAHNVWHIRRRKSWKHV